MDNSKSFIRGFGFAWSIVPPILLIASFLGGANEGDVFVGFCIWAGVMIVWMGLDMSFKSWHD